MYILGFQEVVPLNAGNVLGEEDTKPIPKWEAIIRTLNKSPQSKTKYKSYNAPPSLVTRTSSAADALAEEIDAPKIKIGTKQFSGAGYRWLQDRAIQRSD